MNRLLKLAIVGLVASCGGGNYSPPRNMDNACAIVQERPHYLRAMKQAERKWGVPVPVQMAVIYQESKFIGDARTPHRYMLGIIPVGRQSSAYGYSQALDGTWDDYQKETGNRRGRRNDIEDATDFMGWYMNKSQSKLGISKSDATSQYLAYHEGQGGYARKSYRAKPWLIRVANRVGERAQTYSAQLQACGRI